MCIRDRLAACKQESGRGNGRTYEAHEGSLFGGANVYRPLRCREEAPDHRLEDVEGRGVVGIVERRLVVELAEPGGVLEVRMTPELLAHVAVHSEVVEEIIA